MRILFKVVLLLSLFSDGVETFLQKFGWLDWRDFTLSADGSTAYFTGGGLEILDINAFK
ncbi:hypothetical protein [Sulfurimonas sp.]